MKREDILSRLAAIEREREKRRKDCAALEGYNRKKSHKKQIAFHKCKKRNRWAVSYTHLRAHETSV